MDSTDTNTDTIQEKKEAKENTGGITTKKLQVFAQKTGRALLINILLGYMLLGILGLWLSKISAGEGVSVPIYEKLSGFADIWGHPIPPFQNGIFTRPTGFTPTPTPGEETSFSTFFKLILHATLNTNLVVQNKIFDFLRKNCSEPVILFLSAWLLPLYFIFVFLMDIPLLLWYPTQFFRPLLFTPSGMNWQHLALLVFLVLAYFSLGGIIIAPLIVWLIFMTQNMFTKSPYFGKFFIGNLSAHSQYFLLIFSWYIYHNSALYLGTQASYAFLLGILISLYFFR